MVCFITRFGFPTAAGRLFRLALAALCGGISLHAQDRGLAEYQIKALFVFNFVQFVEWPPATFPAPDSPLRIGILGDNPFGDALHAAVHGEKVAGRPVEIVMARHPDGLKDCHAVFVSRGERARVDAILNAFARRPILTIGDAPNFAAQGGILGFYREGEKVRFELNRSAAQQANLKLSAQLVRLARVVDQPGEKP